jgi:hypothetical protein
MIARTFSSTCAHQSVLFLSSVAAVTASAVHWQPRQSANRHSTNAEGFIALVPVGLADFSASCSGLALLLASLGARAVTEYGTSGGCEVTLLMPTLGIAQRFPWGYPLCTLPYQSCDSLCPGLRQFTAVSVVPVVAVASEHSSCQLHWTLPFQGFWQICARSMSARPKYNGTANALPDVLGLPRLPGCVVWSLQSSGCTYLTCKHVDSPLT